jgi:hypothetical protein
MATNATKAIPDITNNLEVILVSSIIYDPLKILYGARGFVRESVDNGFISKVSHIG